MKVSIICCKPNTKFPIFSWVIRYVQNTDFSHMAICLDAEEKVIDSTIHKVRWQSTYEFRKAYTITKKYLIEIPEGVEDVYAWSDQYLGRDYSILQNIGLGLRHLKLIASNPFGNDDRLLVCSEICALFIYRFKNIALDDSDNYDLIRASELAEEVSYASFP